MVFSGVGIDPGEVELAGDEKDDGTDGAEADVSASLALGRLEQPVDGLQEAVGLTRSDPGEDALEMTGII